MRRSSVAFSILAMSICSTSVSQVNFVTRRKEMPEPHQGKIPKQKAQYGKPPRKLHNNGIGRGTRGKNR